MLQRHAIQKLHRNKSLAILLPDVVNRANIRVIQCGCGLRLALETSQRLSVSGNLLRQELQCDETMQPRVLGLVHHTHPAAAKLLDDAVVRDGLTDHGNAGTQGCHVRSAARTKSTEAYGGYRAKLTQCLASPRLTSSMRRAQNFFHSRVSASPFAHVTCDLCSSCHPPFDLPHCSCTKNAGR